MSNAKQQAVLVISDASGPNSVVIFQGKNHTFYSLEKMGMDELEGLLNNNMLDKKIPAENSSTDK